MRHPVLILTRNNLELTKRAIDSVIAQDIPTEIHVIDNDSIDGTLNWLREAREFEILSFDHFRPQMGVSAAWNLGISMFLDDQDQDHVLVINNDVILPPHFYRMLLECNKDFVTGIAIDDLERSREIPMWCPLAPNPDFSAFLIRKGAFDIIGHFNERMVLYASDTDYHVRGHRLGVGMWKANVPYYHERSSTIRTASDRAALEERANADRAVFRELYGCVPGTPEYSRLFE